MSGNLKPPKPHLQGSELEKEFELERMILFSDAVFAIAITLVAIDIKWPELPENLKGVNLYNLLQPTILEFIGFVLSFFYIGRSWSQHLRLCRLLKTYDQGLINLNLWYLFFIVLFPFTASGIVGHVATGFILPFFLYSFNLAAVAVIHTLMLRYVIYKKPNLLADREEWEKKYLYVRAIYSSTFIAALFVMTILVAIFVHGDPDYIGFVYLLIPFGLRYAGLKANKHKPKVTASGN